MRRTTSVAAAAVLLLALPHTAAAQQFLRSMYDLEDPRGYCLDIPGFGQTMQLDAPIYTHSCKYGSPGFDVDEILQHTSEKLRFVNFDRCLAADPPAHGGKVSAVNCEDAHGWRIHPDGRVTPGLAADLCLTLDSARIFVNTGVATVPPYSTRSLSLQSCTIEASYRQRWRWSATDERSTYSANSMRSGVPLEVQRHNEEIGPVINPQATGMLYRDAERTFSEADVTISAEISYGADDRQLLQVYEGKNRNPPGGRAPVILLVHGGGFGGGGLASLEHVATQFAGLGFIAVNMTYPLAPGHTWPSGAESVAAAVAWLADHVADYRGDPERLYVVGHSAGASHVADYVLRPSLSSQQRPKLAGAILCSPWFELDAAGPAASYASYFAGTGRAWAEVPLLSNIEDAAVPLLITVAEYDPQPFLIGTARLYARLIDEFGVRPRLRQIPGHGHISYISAVGTADNLFLEEALDFILDTP